MTASTETAADPRKIEMLLGQLDELPALAPVATRILALTQDDKSSTRQLVALVGSDPSLTARVLSVCGKASAGVRPESLTIEKAVSLLGFETIRQLTLAQKVMEVFTAPPDPADASGLDRPDFWRHCLAVACASRRIAVELRSGLNPEESFVLGLLHDLGKIALDTTMPKSFARVLKRSDETRGEIADVERSVLGVDHTVVGRRLAERWGLPQPIVDVVWLHHHPPEALPAAVAAKKHVQVVQLADAMAREHRIGFSGNHGTSLSSRELAAKLGLSEAARIGIIESLAEQLEARSAWIGDAHTTSREVYLRALLKTGEDLTAANTRLAEQNQRLQRRARYLVAVDQLNGRVTPGLSVRETAAVGADALRSVFDSTCVVVVVPSSNGGWLDIGIADTAMRSRIEQREEDAPDIAGDLTSAADIGASGAWILPPGRSLDPLIDRFRTDLGNGPVWLMPIVSRNRPVAFALFSIEPDAAARLRSESDELAAASAALGLAIAQAQAQATATALAEDLAAANRRLAGIQPELLRAKTLESIVAMSAGAAHELNNPLAVISGRAQLLAARADNEETKRDLATIAAQARVCSDIVTDLMAFAQPDPVRPQSVDVVAAINAVASAMVSEGLLDAIALSIEPAPLCPNAWVDPAALSVIFRELLDNAIESTDPNDRRLTVKIAGDLAEENLVVTVADNGRGMTPDVLARAMDPFFSHRPAGRGRGVGLSRVQRLLEIGGGSIRIESQPGIGTQARVLLPIRRADASDLSDAT